VGVGTVDGELDVPDGAGVRVEEAEGAGVAEEPVVVEGEVVDVGEAVVKGVIVVDTVGEGVGEGVLLAGD